MYTFFIIDWKSNSFDQRRSHFLCVKFLEFEQYCQINIIDDDRCEKYCKNLLHQHTYYDPY